MGDGETLQCCYSTEDVGILVGLGRLNRVSPLTKQISPEHGNQRTTKSGVGKALYNGEGIRSRTALSLEERERERRRGEGEGQGG